MEDVDAVVGEQAVGVGALAGGVGAVQVVQVADDRLDLRALQRQRRAPDAPREADRGVGAEERLGEPVLGRPGQDAGQALLVDLDAAQQALVDDRLDRRLEVRLVERRRPPPGCR